MARKMETRFIGLSNKFGSVSELESKILGMDTFSEQKIKVVGQRNKIESHKAIWNENENVLASMVTNKYMLVQHKEAFLPLIDTLKKTGMTNVTGFIGATKNQASMFVKFDDPRATIDLGNGDIVQMAVWMRHSVDGYLALHGTLGGYRMVCANGMMVGKILGGVRQIHKGSTVKAFTKHFYTDLIKVMMDNSDKLRDIIKRSMAELLKQEWLEAMIRGTGIGKNYTKKILEKCKKLDKVYTWDLYNMMTAFITHEMERSNFNSRIAYLETAGKVLVMDAQELIELGRQSMAKDAPTKEVKI